MDYELKYVIAICLIVKIAALSPEFSNGVETESLEQSPSRAEASFPPSPETQATADDRRNQGRLFDWGPGRRQFDVVKGGSRKGVTKSKKIKENQSFDTCEHRIELLESSLNWRDIRKTLHWLDRMLSSNQTNMELCRRRKDPKRRFHAQIKRFEFLPKPKNRNFFKESTGAEPKWAKIYSKTATRSRRNKKSRKERQHKRRSWKSRLREEWNKEEKHKNKRKEFRFGKYFHKKNLPKFSPNNLLSLNTTILKPNSDVEKIFFRRIENKGENNFKSHQFGESAIKQPKMCEGLQCTQKSIGGPERESRNLTTGRWSEEVKSGEHETKMPKQKPWPHFVYHRVSSNFLHPNSANQNHRQSAYIAISVVTSSKPDSTDNNDIM